MRRRSVPERWCAGGSAVGCPLQAGSQGILCVAGAAPVSLLGPATSAPPHVSVTRMAAPPPGLRGASSLRSPPHRGDRPSPSFVLLKPCGTSCTRPALALAAVASGETTASNGRRSPAPWRLACRGSRSMGALVQESLPPPPDHRTRGPDAPCWRRTCEPRSPLTIGRGPLPPRLLPAGARPVA
jgi:hypothetical protein